jgi:hypothetical protein
MDRSHGTHQHDRRMSIPQWVGCTLGRSLPGRRRQVRATQSWLYRLMSLKTLYDHGDSIARVTGARRPILESPFHLNKSNNMSHQARKTTPQPGNMDPPRRRLKTSRIMTCRMVGSGLLAVGQAE